MDTYEQDRHGLRPGADDDGSGVATVLQIMTAVMQSKMKFKRDLYFAFYAAEEKGLVGSARVVKEFEKRRVTLKGVMQFDMTGFRSPKDTQDIFFIEDFTNPELTKFLKALTVKYLGIIPSQIGRILCNYACSDHASWTRAGYPAAAPAEAAMENLNETLHTPRDVMELLNVPHAMKYVNLGAAFVVELGEPQGQNPLF
jgi:leucyl aminopeptidase